jgi:aconitate hydratase
MWREGDGSEPVFTDTLELDLGDVVPSMAGPKRPEGRIALENIASGFASALEADYKKPGELDTRYAVEGTDFDLGHGDVAIAAITSCTNTSNPSVLIAAGLLARNAVAKGLKTKPWVKTSLAPGSQVAGESSQSPVCRRISTSSASTSSASAAPPASAIPARCRRRSPRRSTTRA